MVNINFPGHITALTCIHGSGWPHLLECAHAVQQAALTLPSMTATQELVVPRSIPMMSEPPDACLAALELQNQQSRSQAPCWQMWLEHVMNSYLNALRSNGPDLIGRAASESYNPHDKAEIVGGGRSPVECTPISCSSHLRCMQRSQRAWPGQNRQPAQLPVPDVAGTLRHRANHTECGPCEAAWFRPRSSATTTCSAAVMSTLLGERQ